MVQRYWILDTGCLMLDKEKRVIQPGRAEQITFAVVIIL